MIRNIGHLGSLQVSKLSPNLFGECRRFPALQCWHARVRSKTATGSTFPRPPFLRAPPHTANLYLGSDWPACDRGCDPDPDPRPLLASHCLGRALIVVLDPLLVVVLGPTASGKTALSLALAERFHGEVVNCDSVAMVREFDIGTAKPSASERARAAHHLL